MKMVQQYSEAWFLTHWPLGDVQKSQENFIQMQIFSLVSGDFLLKLIWGESYGSQVNIGWGCGLVPSGIKP